MYHTRTDHLYCFLTVIIIQKYVLKPVRLVLVPTWYRDLLNNLCL
jgi:hypothetical protein